MRPAPASAAAGTGASPRLEVVPAGPLVGEVTAPGSKSVTNRLLLLAALAQGTSVLRGPLDSDDSAAMRDVVRALGAAVEESGGAAAGVPAWRVHGTGGRVATPDQPLDCRLSGTTMRFGTAVAALAEGPVVLTGAPPLRRRPIGPLVDALAALGATAASEGGLPPVRVGGGLAGGRVRVDVRGSSQFASAVLLASPHARSDVALQVDGAHAGAYVDLTVEAMRAWGAVVAEDGAGGWVVTAGPGYAAREVDVEHDASAAAHLLALAVATGGRVTVVNAGPTLQPDAGMGAVLEAFGASVDVDGRRTTATGPDRPRPAGRLDLSAMPDQVTTAAALAALADGPTEITGVAVARLHETDRLAALARELARVGARVEERPDGLVVDGRPARGGGPEGVVLATSDDHRLAMAFAAVGARLPGVVVADPGCVAKTFPAFWTAFEQLGGRVRTP